ncbi:CDP-4-dehydro-6-deoxy-D-gulose 4-reductase [Bacillus cereus Rock1-15]|nr:CDP-4-dehydro-6-deoxy-D-gulose 4-reductase [Bacillus cereus Rock1-15]
MNEMARLNIRNELFYFVIAKQVYFMPMAREVRGVIFIIRGVHFISLLYK